MQTASGVEFLLIGGDTRFYCAYHILNLFQCLIKFIFIVHNSDPRVADWTFMSNPLPLTLILISYLFIIYVVGPA